MASRRATITSHHSLRVAGRMFDSLRVPTFRDLWVGMLASYIGMYMGMVSRGYLAYEITGSATVLGIVTVASGIPMLLLSPVGGVLADIMNRRLILIHSQVFMVVSSLLIAALIHFDLIEIWHLAFFGLLQGILFTINMPARSSALPHLVGRPLLASAIGLTNSGRNLMSVIAPAIAGTVIAIPWLGTAGAFDISAAFYVGATLLMLRLPESLAESRKRTQVAFGQQMIDGFNYIFLQRPLRILLVLGLIPIVFGMPLQSFLPVFQADVLRVGAVELGLLYSAVGVGGTLGSLMIAPLAESKHSHILQLVMGVFFGLTLVAFANSTSFTLRRGLHRSGRLCGKCMYRLQQRIADAAHGRSVLWARDEHLHDELVANDPFHAASWYARGQMGRATGDQHRCYGYCHLHGRSVHLLPRHSRR